MLIGVVSDTHGLLRAEVAPALAGVEHILHAGDVGDAEILDRLREIAPVTAIRGNVDTHGPCAELPATEAVELGGCLVSMLHSLAELDWNPKAGGMGVVVFGHTHVASVERRDGVMYLNPGSCGPRRFRLPVTVALLRIEDGLVSAEIMPLLA
jgi:putative phosphoesterase